MLKKTAPSITSLKLSPSVAVLGEPVTANCAVSGHPPIDLFYQWKLDGRALRGAVSASVTAPSSGALTVLVTARNKQGSAIAESAPVQVTMMLRAPQVTELPRISGPAEIGQVLRVESDGVFSGHPVPTLSRNWQCNGANIAGATGTDYSIGSDDADAQIALRVVAENSQGSVAALSAPLLVRGAAAPESAPRYHIALSGSDANDGSAARPFRTISKAAALAQPGDRIVVRGGTYRDLVRIGCSGAPDLPIEFAPFTGEQVIIDGSASTADTSLVVITGHHITFRGFEVRNATRSGISAWGVRHLRILGNRVSGCQRGGIWIGHDTAGASHSNEVVDNIVHGNCLMNQARTMNGGWPVALGLAVSDNSVVRGNRVFNNYGEGIGTMSTHGVEITDNVVHDNFSVMIYLDNAPRSAVRRNIVFHTARLEFYRSDRPANSVVIANEYTAIQLPSSNITVTDNTFAGLREPYYGDYEYGGGLQDSILLPNTMLPASDVDPAWLEF